MDVPDEIFKELVAESLGLIPAEFREVQISKLEKLDGLVTDIKERLRDQRRERRTI